MKDTTQRAQNTYLSLLSLAAGWYLGAEEASEIISDYKELLACEADDPQPPKQRFGSPAPAARMLAEGRSYRQWLFTFAAMGVCVLWLLGRVVWGWSSYYRDWSVDLPGILAYRIVPWVPFGLGLLTALCGPLRRGARGTAGIGRQAGVLAALMAAGGAVAVYIVSICNSLMNSVREGRPEHFLMAKVVSLHTVMLLAGIALAIAALAALAASRCFDRRWRSVYALALAMLAMLVKLAVILNMLSDPDALWPAVAQELWPVALVGLAGTGLSLL